MSLKFIQHCLHLVSFPPDRYQFCFISNTLKRGKRQDNVYIKSEVFKLWVGTQTWVVLALILGREPFCDPKKQKQNWFTIINIINKPKPNHFALQTWNKMTTITPNFDKLCAAQQVHSSNTSFRDFFSRLGGVRFWCWNLGHQDFFLKTPALNDRYDVFQRRTS